MRESGRHGEPKWEYLGIQALRAAAAFAVVFGHSMNFLERGTASLPTVVTDFQGAVGVDLFFVISGFVMTISAPRLLRRTNPSRIFLWRRLLRVAPLYWLLTSLKLLIVFAVPWLDLLNGQPSAWNIGASFLFVPSLNRHGEIRPVISLGWTLNFEMAFYLLFAVSLLAKRRLLWVLLPLVGALALLGVVRPASAPVWTSLADPIVLEFAAGVVIAACALGGRLPSRVVGGACVAGGAAGLLWLSPGLSPLSRAVHWGVPAALVVLGTVSLEEPLRRRLPRWVLLLGSASYSIYLVQVFIFPLVDGVALRVGAADPGASPRLLAVAVVVWSVLLTAVAGVGTHLLVERPLTQQLQRRFGRERIAPIAREG